MKYKTQDQNTLCLKIFLKEEKKPTRKERRCLDFSVSKPLFSHLWGCGESVNQGALSSRSKGRPRPATHFSDFVTFVTFALAYAIGYGPYMKIGFLTAMRTKRQSSRRLKKRSRPFSPWTYSKSPGSWREKTLFSSSGQSPRAFRSMWRPSCSCATSKRRGWWDWKRSGASWYSASLLRMIHKRYIVNATWDVVFLLRFSVKTWTLKKRKHYYGQGLIISVNEFACIKCHNSTRY